MVTALIEVATGLSLLLLPAIPFAWLLDVRLPSAEAVVIASIAGAALVAIGITCFIARNDGDTLSRRAVLAGILIYDLAAAALLAYSGAFLGMAGIALWPAVGLHSFLAVWCLTGFWGNRNTAGM